MYTRLFSVICLLKWAFGWWVFRIRDPLFLMIMQQHKIWVIVDAFCSCAQNSKKNNAFWNGSQEFLVFYFFFVLVELCVAWCEYGLNLMVWNRFISYDCLYCWCTYSIWFEKLKMYLCTLMPTLLFSGPRIAQVSAYWFCCHMGISFSCPFAKYNDVEDGLDSVVVKSINFGNDEIKTPVRSVSFKKEDLEPTILKSLGSGKMTIETSVSFKRKDIDEIISTNTLSFEKEENMPIARTGKKIKEMDDMPLKSENQVETIQSALLNPSSPKHIAALKLQKVYKSFRTRRKLADCAILVEQSWYLFNGLKISFLFHKTQCVSNMFLSNLWIGGSF